MVIKKELLDILVCPETKKLLKVADSSLVLEINKKIEQEELTNVAGDKVLEAIESALVREDGKVLYPVRNDIPVMLIEEGISLQS